MRFALALVLLPGLAVAQTAPADAPSAPAVIAEPERPERAEVPKLGAPAPLLMPELTARTRFQVSPLVSSALLVNTLQLEVGGTFAIHDLELFADIHARLAGFVPLDGPSGENGNGLGNARIGARYDISHGKLSVAPSVWGWLPTGTGSNTEHAVLEQMSGAEDWRAFGTGASAVGVALDAAWRTSSAFVQLEAGAALVSDRGVQVDNVFGAIGAGTRAARRISLLAEWRVEMVPGGDRMHGPAVGFGGERGTTEMWRVRLHPYVFSGEQWGGLAVGFDYIHRFN